MFVGQRPHIEANKSQHSVEFVRANVNMSDEEIVAGAFAVLSVNNYILALQKRKRQARKR